MRILEICPYSAGICGVWNRVKEESTRLSHKHDVLVFSSDRIKGSGGRAESEDRIGHVKIMRFPALKLGGESFMYWNFKKEAEKFNPDLIIAHNYRHLHTTQALALGLKMNKPVFLVTHAPFVKGNTTRTALGSMVVNLYDLFIGPEKLNKFSKIIGISKWENEYLHRLGVKDKNIVHIPNGIPEEFFDIDIKKGNKNKILFLGRVAPIKKIETLIDAVALLKDLDLQLDIVGPAEKRYQEFLNNKINELKINSKIRFLGPVSDLKEKINLIDNYSIFVLPSQREGMPQALVEAMARERIVIASDTEGAKDIISNGKNGYLFKMGDAEELAKVIKKALKGNNKMVRIARKNVEQYSWPNIIKKLEKIL